MNNTPCYLKHRDVKPSEIFEDGISGLVGIKLICERGYLAAGVICSPNVCSSYDNGNGINGISECASPIDKNAREFAVPFNPAANAFALALLAPVDAQHLDKRAFTTGELILIINMSYSTYISAPTEYNFLILGYELDKG